MSPKHVAAVIVAVVLSAGAAYAQESAAPPAQPQTASQRLEKQKNRRARAIHLKELRDRQANGGTLTDQEKAELTRALNRKNRRRT